jgi:hypothetical protein
VPITGEVGVLVLGKDTARTSLVADVIHNQLQKLGMPAVIRHEFSDVGKSHAIDYDQASVLDILSRRDPKLFGTAVVVAHDNIGQRLVGKANPSTPEVLEPAAQPASLTVPPGYGNGAWSMNSAADRDVLEDIAYKFREDAEEFLFDATARAVIEVSKNFEPDHQLRAMRHFLTEADLSSAGENVEDRAAGFIEMLPRLRMISERYGNVLPQQPSISGAMTIPARNPSLEKLEAIVDTLEKMSKKKVELFDSFGRPLGDVSQPPMNQEERSARVRFENLAARAKEQEEHARRQAMETVERVHQQLVKNAQTTVQTIEDLLEDARELPPGKYEYEDGIKMVNGHDGVFLELPNGVKVGRF